MDRSGSVRGVALGVVAFVATLLLLLGISAVADRPPTVAGTASGATASVPRPSVALPSASAAASRPSSRPTIPSPTPTPTAATIDPILVGAGDIADCASDGDEATAALLDGIPGTVFTAGDNAYENGTADEFRDCYDPTWGRHRERTWPAPGNHDWRTDDLAGYRGYFGTAAGDDGASWYARDLGTWRVIVLDSDCARVDGCGPDSPQGRWLAEELAASTVACTVAIFHHPRFSSGDEHGDDPAVDPFWRALYGAGVDVVINGHEHSYERFAPQDPDGRSDPARGIREFVVGTGGRALRGFGDPRPNSELRASLTVGVLALTLRPGAYAWTFRGAGSDFTDTGSGRCH